MIAGANLTVHSVRPDNQTHDAETAESAPWDPVERRAMVSFAKDLHERACLLDDTTLLDESLRIQKDVLDRTPPDHPERAMILTRLAISLDRQFLTTGDSTSLFDAIVWLKQAASLCPPGHPGRGYVRRNLAKSLCRWVEATEDGSSLTEVLKMAQEEYAAVIQKVENSENIGASSHNPQMSPKVSSCNRGERRTVPYIPTNAQISGCLISLQ